MPRFSRPAVYNANWPIVWFAVAHIHTWLGPRRLRVRRGLLVWSRRKQPKARKVVIYSPLSVKIEAYHEPRIRLLFMTGRAYQAG
jgi:hypothetical protein